MTRRWWPLLVLLAAAACTSPEASRSRGGTGADVGNHPSGPVQLHDGAQMYFGTRTHGAGIGERAFIRGAAEAEGR
jgi:hypothetical protein